MPIVNVTQATFTRGELTPLLHSRIDIDHFKMGLARCLNFLTLRYGGLRRRSGTKFVAEVHSDTEGMRLMPFVFNQQQAYVIEVGHEYMRFIHQRTPLGVDGDGGILATPFGIDLIYELHYMQSNDILFLAHRSIRPKELRREAHTTWSIHDFVSLDGPYLPVNVENNNVVCTPSGHPDNYDIGDDITLTWDSTTNINNGDGFSAPNDVGRHVRVYAGDNKWAWFSIKSVTNATTVVATLMDHGDGFLPGAQNTQANGDGRLEEDEWRLGAWTDALGWPARLTFFESRSAWGRSDSFPSTIWYSMSFNIDQFSPGDEDNAGLTFTIRANQMQEIMWLGEGNHTLIGTFNSARSIGASDFGAPLSGSNLTQRKGSNFGSEPIQPISVDTAALFVSSYGLAIREMVFSATNDSYEAPDITVLSDHFFTEGIKDFCYAQEPDQIVWIVTNDGKLIGLTYDRSQRVVGFHEHVLGGVDVKVESICTIPNSVKRYDEVYLLVRRKVGDTYKRFIEVMEKSFYLEDQKHGYFVDCGYTYDGEATNTVTGLDWLEGEEVDIVADGAVQPRQTVTDGTITLRDNRTASVIHIGYAYDSIAETLPFNLQTTSGELFGQPVRVVRALIDVYRTRGLKLSTQSGEEKVILRSPDDLMGNAPELRTGVFKRNLPDSWFNGGKVGFKVDQPVPCTIRSLTLQIEV